MNLKAVGELLGLVVLLMAAFLLVPVGVGFWYQERQAALDFTLSALIALVPGTTLVWRFRGQRFVDGDPDRPDFHRREGLAVVGLSWLVGGAAAAVPYALHGPLPSFVDAYFEAVSGLTTTGSTVMSGEMIDGMDHATAFWRSFTHWLGGFGIVMVFVVLFPTGGRSLFRSELPGVSREAGHKRVRESALTLMRIYVGITVIELVLLLLAGMGGFDALLHAFGTIPTGGFSNKSASVAAFGSASIEVVITLGMLVCGFNFAHYETLLRSGPRAFLKRLWSSSEARTFLGLFVVCTVGIALLLWFDGGTNGGVPPDARSGWKDYRSLTLCFRDSSFVVASLSTCCGYGTANYDTWPELARSVLMLLVLVGACAGSTGGGIKVIRAIVLVKVGLASINRFVRPRAVERIYLDGEVLDEGQVSAMVSHVSLWFFVFLLGWMFFAAFGYDLVSSATAVVTALSNAGPGLAQFGPFENFSGMPDLLKLGMSMLMILGRLEFYAVACLFVPSFWKR